MLPAPFSGSGGNLPQPFGGGGGSNLFQSNDFLGGLGSIFQGLFGNSGSPYGAAQNQIQQMLQQGGAGYQPYMRAGQQAINPFRQGINQMKDPSTFINNILGQYEQSPYAKFQTGEAQRGSNAAAAASGLTGSTVHQNAAADYARNIASQDMQQWLQNNLGVNNTYLQGLMGLMGGGLQGAGGMANLYGQAMGPSSQAAFGQRQGGQNDFMSMLGGAANIGKSLLPFFL